jgi:lipopolysaccharide transport system ATP-binding protein
MPAILRLCNRAILLDHGGVIVDGGTQEVVRRYLESDLGRTTERIWTSPDEAPGDDVARLKSIKVIGGGRATSDEIDVREPVDVEVEYWSKDPGNLQPSTNVHFYNDEGVCLFINNDWNDRTFWARKRERNVIVRSTCHIPANFLAEGRLIVTVAVSSFNPLIAHAVERDAVAFQMVDRSEGEGVRGVFTNEWPGVVRPMLDWNVESRPWE